MIQHDPGSALQLLEMVIVEFAQPGIFGSLASKEAEETVSRNKLSSDRSLFIPQGGHRIDRGSAPCWKQACSCGRSQEEQTYGQ